MKPTLSPSSELLASLSVNETNLEPVLGSIDSTDRGPNGARLTLFAGSSPTHRFAKLALLGIAVIGGLHFVSAVSAADPTSATAATIAPVPSQKPVWLTDLSIGVKDSYDDNVFLSAVTPTSQVIPVGGVEESKDRSSWVTTVSPKLGFDFASLFGDPKTLQAVIVGYAPDFVTYHIANTESYDIQRFTTTVKGQVDDFSFNFDNGFSYIDGSKYGPSYSAGLSAYATGTVRERREQYQDRSTITVKFDQENWFVRPTASLLYYNLETAQLTAAVSGPGYQNYADRSDVNGGADFGYKLTKDLAVTLGYRDGRQFQQAYAAAIDPYQQSSSSDYQRVLLGFEGKVASWLDLKVQAGPDFRSYDKSAPVPDDKTTKYYGEAAVTATLSKQDTISFNYRQWQWVSSTGKVPYFDSTFDLNYKHKFSDKLSGNLGARLLGSNYTSGLAAGAGSTPDHIIGTTNTRNDLFYTLSAGVQYAFTANFSANLAYSYDLGRNGEDGLSAAVVAPRQFNRALVSAGVAFKF